jgi:predicted DNA-binding transcriptional regulator AlpA
VTRLLRFADLHERGIARSWAQLKNLQKRGFPLGKMLSPNCRVWSEDEINGWLASRPVEGPALRGAAKARRGRPRKAAVKPHAPVVNA